MPKTQSVPSVRIYNEGPMLVIRRNGTIIPRVKSVTLLLTSSQSSGLYITRVGDETEIVQGVDIDLNVGGYTINGAMGSSAIKIMFKGLQLGRIFSLQFNMDSDGAIAALNLDIRSPLGELEDTEGVFEVEHIPAVKPEPLGRYALLRKAL